MIKNMDEEKRSGLMELRMLDNIMLEKNMAMENFSEMMEHITKEHFKII